MNHDLSGKSLSVFAVMNRKSFILQIDLLHRVHVKKYFPIISTTARTEKKTLKLIEFVGTVEIRKSQSSR